MVLPEELENVPLGHSAQSLSRVAAPSVDDLPAGQLAHLKEPGVLAKVPGEHSSQEVLPLKAEKVPKVQLAQALSRLVPPSEVPSMPLGQ